jgi:hypothetical protein
VQIASGAEPAVGLNSSSAKFMADSLLRLVILNRAGPRPRRWHIRTVLMGHAVRQGGGGKKKGKILRGVFLFAARGGALWRVRGCARGERAKP